MKHFIKQITFLIVCMFAIQSLFAQTLLDSAALLQQRVYKSLSIALQNPDSVFILDLSRDKLKTVPTDVFKLSKLQVLNLSHNNLKQLPAEIGLLTNLQQLNLSNNNLKELPTSIGDLINLTYLGLNRNLIEALPAEMGKLKSLEVLEMWDNELSIVPGEVKGMYSLKVWELRGILFTQEEQNRIHSLLPDTRIYFSPTCNCKK